MTRVVTEERQKERGRYVASKYRRLPKLWRRIAIALSSVGIIVALINVFNIIIMGRVMLDVAYLYFLLAIFLPLVFIWIPARQGTDNDTVPWYDILLAIISFAVPFSFYLRTFREIIMGWESAAPLDGIIFGTILWALIIEVSRRCVNRIFAIVISLVSAFPLYAFIMPALLRSSPFSFVRVASFHAFSENSIMGIPVHVFGTTIMGFLVFAACMQAAGTGKFFNNLALALLGETRAGAAKVSIVASGFFGMISGSPGANILTTGAFTIPAMKKAGFPAHLAGAVEANASSGGSLMPPIMGASAFIMAEFLEITYAQVCIVAIIPSLLYYLTLFFQIDAYAARVGLKPEPITVAIPKIWRILFDNLHLLLGFFTLVFLLFVMYWIRWSPWIATAAVFGLAMLRRDTRLRLRDYVNFIEDAGRNLAELLGMLAAVGLIIGSLIMTGIAYSLPYTIIAVAKGNIYLMILFGAIAAFVLGTGMPIIAAYIFLALVLAPGLIQAGLDPQAVHIFVMYCALWSFVTPPVALSAFIAAIVAEADAMKTAVSSMRMGIGKYFVPFFFVLSPAMVFRGPLLESLQVIPTSILGLILISGAMEGYMWRIGNINIPLRVLFFASGFLLAFPTTTTDIWGAGLAAILISSFLINKTVKGDKGLP
ncbi:TRAP transporter permease [Chloroflexota bacterium]